MYFSSSSLLEYIFSSSLLEYRVYDLEGDHANGGTRPILPMEESGRNPANSEETAPRGHNEETNLNQQMET